MRLLRLIAIAAATLALSPVARGDGPALQIVAAENFYGDLARQVGGPCVAVTSILSNPSQDPHEFEASASTARAIADARLVIYSGADYDPWMRRLLSASRSSSRTVIVAADLAGRKPGDNPHVWYDPKTMPLVAKALADAFSAADPAHAGDYRSRLETVLASLETLQRQVADIRARYAGAPVTATEPVFGYMAEALGLEMRNRAFQTAVMNATEPSPSQIIAMERDLRTRSVRVLFYNSQVTDDLTARLLKLARDSGVAVVGITETEPAGMSYQQWISGGLEATAKALAGPGS